VPNSPGERTLLKNPARRRVGLGMRGGQGTLRGSGAAGLRWKREGNGGRRKARRPGKERNKKEKNKEEGRSLEGGDLFGKPRKRKKRSEGPD